MPEDLFGFEPVDSEPGDKSQQRPASSAARAETSSGDNDAQDSGAASPDAQDGGAASPDSQDSATASPADAQDGGAASPDAQDGAAASPDAQDGGVASPDAQDGGAASPAAQDGGVASPDAQDGGVASPDASHDATEPQGNLGGRQLPRQQPDLAENLYFWHQTAWQQLYSQLKRLPHALLIHAPEGYALDLFADTLCRQLLVNADDGVEEALFDSGNHPELHVIEPSGNTIGVDAVREGISWLYLRSIKAEQKRILLLRDAHKMPRGAANALLKCLEEPPGNGLLLLLSTKPFALPRTVISRCRKLCPYHAERDTVLDWLQSKLPKEQHAAANMLVLSGFGPLMVLQQLDADGLEARTKIFRFLTNPGAAEAIPALAKSWQAMGTAKVLLWWRVLLLAAIREQLGDSNTAGLAAKMAVKGLPQLVAFHGHVVQSEHLYHDRSGMHETALLERLMLLWSIPTEQGMAGPISNLNVVA